MTEDTLTFRVMVRLDEKTGEALERRARADGRKVSQYVRILIERDVAECYQSTNGNGTHPAPDAA